MPQNEWPDYPGCGESEHADATTSFYQTKTGKLVAIVTVDKQYAKKKHLSVVVGLLVHEATHVWRRIKQNLGEDSPSSEFEAYAMQNITQSLVEAYLDNVR